MNRVDLIGGAVLSLVGILLIFVVIPLGTEEGMYFGLSPTLFPTLLASCMTLCAIALTTQAWLRLRAGGETRPIPISRWNFLMFIGSAVIVVAGVLAIDFFGIVLAGPALIAGLMLFLGERSLVRIALTSTLPVAAVYFLAMHVLRTPLP